MKLRNKKTGEIVDFKIIADYDDCTSGWRLEKQDGSVLFYDHIDEINEEWEDYKPKEPLIKDEKIRKAVRAWANLNMLKRVAVNPPTEDCSIISFTYGMLEIGFFLGRSDISGGTYTIAELCGEEEE